MMSSGMVLLVLNRGIKMYLFVRLKVFFRLTCELGWIEWSQTILKKSRQPNAETSLKLMSRTSR